MAWAQNLLGLCLFGCAPDAAFLGFAWWLKFRFAWWLKFRSGWGTIPLFLGVPKATFRDFWGCSSAMAWTENLLGLCLFGRAPDAAFLGFAWWLKFRSGVSKSNVSAFFWLRFRVARVLFLCFFFVFILCFSGFQKRRFGIFPAAVSQWLGHKTCWGSAFSHARPKHLFLAFGLVACRLFLCF